MQSHDSHIWGIILAAGDGKRLKHFVRSEFNSDRPKQFCVFTGTRSMLSHTIARVERFIPLERIIVTINAGHAEYAKHDIGSLDKRNVIVQPSNRETTASIMFPLLQILHRDPAARVIVFPSDHFIMEEHRFMQHVAAGDAFIARHPKYLLLLGVHMEHHVTDYGWIEASMKIAEIDGSEIFRVNRFLEKPDTEKASTLQKNRTLCNTMVFVGYASTILRKFRLTTPFVYHAFRQIETALYSPNEGGRLEEAYAALPSVDFSKVILSHDPRGLAVLHAKDVYWSDWGNAARIQADIAGLLRESEM